MDHTLTQIELGLSLKGDSSARVKTVKDRMSINTAPFKLLIGITVYTLTYRKEGEEDRVAWVILAAV